jgi:hypothetical protein
MLKLDQLTLSDLSIIWHVDRQTDVNITWCVVRFTTTHSNLFPEPDLTTNDGQIGVLSERRSTADDPWYDQGAPVRRDCDSYWRPSTFGYPAVADGLRLTTGSIV